MEMERRVEVPIGAAQDKRRAAGVDLGGEALVLSEAEGLGDMPVLSPVEGRVTQMLAHHGPVPGLRQAVRLRSRQAVVVGVPGTRLGELHPEFLSHFGDLVVAVLRAVVGMKAEALEGETCQQFAANRQPISLADPFAGGHQCPLGFAVHGVAVPGLSGAEGIDPLEAV